MNRGESITPNSMKQKNPTPFNQSKNLDLAKLKYNREVMDLMDPEYSRY